MGGMCEAGDSGCVPRHEPAALSGPPHRPWRGRPHVAPFLVPQEEGLGGGVGRSEEHTSELQSQSNVVCRLLLEKKKRMKEERRGRANLLAKAKKGTAAVDVHGDNHR